MADITVTGTLLDLGGKPATGRKVTFLCDTQMLGEEFLEATTQEAVADKEGKFKVVFPRGANVQILLPGGQRVSVTLPEKASVDFDALVKSAQ